MPTIEIRNLEGELVFTQTFTGIISERRWTACDHRFGLIRPMTSAQPGLIRCTRCELELTITCEGGRATLVLDAFFPTPKTWRDRPPML